MSGRLSVIGIGPGNPDQLTPQARQALEAATDVFGYEGYLKRLTFTPDQRVHVSDNRQEIARADAALTLAASGSQVAVVSGGDPGVFAMAAAVCEAVDHGPDECRQVDIEIVPGITAMLAVAARIGAPLGHDFCAISLSDNLKPWNLIVQRLEAAAKAGFVIALYNPASRARPWQLEEALERLKQILEPQTPIVFGRAAGRPDETISIQSLCNADASRADMATCVIIGSSETRIIERGDQSPLVYTPRFVAEATQ